MGQIKTNKGWLHIYHGVSDQWILQPEDPWEISGYVPNVVFTCGAVAEDDGTVKIYCTGARIRSCAPVQPLSMN